MSSATVRGCLKNPDSTIDPTSVKPYHECFIFWALPFYEGGVNYNLCNRCNKQILQVTQVHRPRELCTSCGEEVSQAYRDSGFYEVFIEVG